MTGPSTSCCRCGEPTCDFYRRDPLSGKPAKRAWCKDCYELLAAIAQWCTSAQQALSRSRWVPHLGRRAA